MDRPDDAVRLRGQEGEEPVLLGDPIGVLALRAPHAGPGPPDPREGEERPVLVEGEPDRRLARLRVGVLAERRDRHEAAMGDPEPGPPVRARDIAHIGDRMLAERLGPRHAPAHHREVPAGRAVQDHRRQLVGKDSRQQRKVSGAILSDPEGPAQVRGADPQAVEVAHGCPGRLESTAPALHASGTPRPAGRRECPGRSVAGAPSPQFRWNTTFTQPSFLSRNVL